MKTNRCRSQRGSASILMLALATVAMVFVVLVADVTSYVATRARAQLAADAAALAAAPVTFRPFGATGSASDEAARFAAENGATLVECRCRHDSTWSPRTVVVRVAIPVDLALLRASHVYAASSADFDPTRLAR